MWNNGNFLTWNHISKLFYDDLDGGLHLVPKISNDHISLTPFSVMNVRLAAKALSESVFQALQSFGPPEAIGTAIYCRMFFDCMNVRNSVEAVTKAKPFLKPYKNVDDERFTWLIGEIFFTQIDLKWGHHLIEMKPGSRHITAFACH